MINGIGSGSSGRIGLARTGTTVRGAPVAAAAADAVDGAESMANPAATLAGMGAPIDAGKIAAIRTAIAEGRYPVNARAIAERMVDLDLPLKF